MRIARSLWLVVVIAAAWGPAAEETANADCTCEEGPHCQCDLDWLISGGGDGQPPPRSTFPAAGPSPGTDRGETLGPRAIGRITNSAISGGFAASHPGAVVHTFTGAPYVADAAEGFLSVLQGGGFFPTHVAATGGVAVAQGVHTKVDANGNGRKGDGSKADPIDPITGEFIITETDLEFPSFGVPFRLVRTYRSRVDLAGPLGPSWDESYNQRLFNLPEVTLDNVPSAPGYPRLQSADVPSPPIIPDADLCGPSLLMTTGEATTIHFRELARNGSTIEYRSSAAHLTLIGTDAPSGPTWVLRSPR